MPSDAIEPLNECAWCGGPITLPNHPGAARKYCSMHCAVNSTEAAAASRRRSREPSCYTCGTNLICPTCAPSPSSA